MSQQLIVRVARIDASLTAALGLITDLRAKVADLEERLEDVETAPRETNESCPTVVEIMPKKRGRPRKIANG